MGFSVHGIVIQKWTGLRFRAVADFSLFGRRHAGGHQNGAIHHCFGPVVFKALA